MKFMCTAGHLHASQFAADNCHHCRRKGQPRTQVQRFPCPRGHSCASQRAAANCVYCRRADSARAAARREPMTKPMRGVQMKGGW